MANGSVKAGTSKLLVLGAACGCSGEKGRKRDR